MIPLPRAGDDHGGASILNHFLAMFKYTYLVPSPRYTISLLILSPCLFVFRFENNLPLPSQRAFVYSLCTKALVILS